MPGIFPRLMLRNFFRWRAYRFISDSDKPVSGADNAEVFQKRQKRELNHENLSMCKQTEGDKMHETAYQKAYNDGAEFSWKGKTLTQDVI